MFQNLPAIKEAKWLTFAKVRGGYAQVGNDTDPYRISSPMPIRPMYNGYPYHFPPYGLYGFLTTLNNPDLKPEMTTPWEFGAELHFFDNRLGVDFTYYSKAPLTRSFL